MEYEEVLDRLVRTAEEIRDAGSSSGRWIASDASRELTSYKVRARLAMES